MHFLLTLSFSAGLLFISSATSSIIGSSRILGGDPAVIKDFPYQISLCRKKTQNSLEHGCGGAIISKTFILTAAHCISMKNIEEHVVLVGSHLRYEGDRYEIKAFFAHPEYNLEKIIHDIGLIHLSNPLEYSEKVAPVAINRNYIQESDLAIVSGFGRSYIDSNLNFAKMRVMTNDECREQSAINAPIYPYTMCAIPLNECAGVGITTGDSGSPLVDIKSNSLIGIASWSTQPEGRCKADGYMRVSVYLDFIDGVMASAK